MAEQIVLTASDVFLSAAENGPQIQAKMAELRAKGVPVIVFTACDRAELEPIRQQLDWTDPFITESGSGIFTPVSHNPFAEPLGEQDGNYYVQALGCPYVQARAGLRVLANAVGHPLKGFGDFTVPQLQKFLGISEAAAHQAKAREFSEPFMTPKAVEAAVLAKVATEMGFAIVLRDAQENRFSELMGAEAELALAVNQLIEAYQNELSADKRLRVLGLSCDPDELSQLAESLAANDRSSVDWQVAVVADFTEWAAAVDAWI